MQKIAAEHIGRRMAVRAFLLLLIPVEFFFLRRAIHNDPAHGLPFYVEQQLNIFHIGLLALLFFTVRYLGRIAGRAILLLHRNYLTTCIHQALITATIFLLYALIAYATEQFIVHAQKSILPTLFQTGSCAIITWPWCTWSMQRKYA